MTHRELVTVAADAAGARRPRFGLPMALVHGFGHLADAAGALLGRDIPLSRQGARLLALTSPASHAKATRELGWHPKPTEHFIQRAAEHYVSRSA